MGLKWNLASAHYLIWRDLKTWRENGYVGIEIIEIPICELQAGTSAKFGSLRIGILL